MAAADMKYHHSWNGQLGRELACAVEATNAKTRETHIEVAAIQLEAEGSDRSLARELVKTALFSRLAFEE